MKNLDRTKGNYKKLCDEWGEKFLHWDHEAMMSNLNMNTFDEEKIKLIYFGLPYSIDRKIGIIRNEANLYEEPDFNTQMAIYHLFFYSKEKPVNCGEWVPFRDVKGAGVFDAAYQRTVLTPFAQAFDGKLELLEKTGIEMGFEKMQYGDVSFLVHAFECIPLIYIFWDGDDEYPASANILFDKNITDFTHAETVVLLASDGVSRIVDKANLFEL